ncbi:hypothetical protein CONPUDRAFT_145098 [Coniophora puteana RWD-64-598 SS2]|uniref:Uncharacterized protein n=1 Tax=Coniophora puteana (strain RWD-64-598) TaxID=741705 RepID=A0A5M3MI97_CONPW|nr:uncharacterized protein CONPUDRAFT_145098 [Coniophora puteana RWD-64-598 SS2]EIW78767.1 hypothetical protein CONPUDRAFT_145098 [Coniophora puteana RWD-64-598 SS2]
MKQDEGCRPSPASICPPEILAIIFEECVDQVHTLPPSDRHPFHFCNKPCLSWIAVTHTCRHWRFAALLDTSLWTRIPTFSKKWSAVFLDRAASRPLQVSEISLFAPRYLEDHIQPRRFRWRNPFKTRRSPALQTRSIEKLITQTRELTITIEEGNIFPLLWEQLPPLPHLQSLSIIGHRTSESDLSLSHALTKVFDGGEAAQLHVLRLQNCILQQNFSYSLLRRITILHVHSLPVSPQASQQELLRILRYTPELQDLVFREYSYPIYLLPDQNSVALPSLRSLEVSAPTNVFAGFFHCLKLIRPLTRLRLEELVCDHTCRNAMPFLAAWDIPYPDRIGSMEICIQTYSCLQTEVYIHVSPTEICEEREVRLKCNLYGRAAASQSLFDLPIRLLTKLTLLAPDLCYLDLRAALEHAPSLRYLVVYPNDFLHLTDTLACSPRGNKLSPAPALETIIFADFSNAAEILELNPYTEINRCWRGLGEFLHCIAQRHTLGYALHRMTFENSRDSWPASVQWSFLEDIGVDLSFGSTALP